jgi:hypothetical protein
MVNFFFDYITNSGIPYPNLGHVVASPGQPQWRNFEHQWPYVTHFRPLLYLKRASQPYQTLSQGNSEFKRAWYPIAIGWFDFAVDYIRLIPEETRQRIASQQLQILFYYHEGDNPELIKNRLDDMCANNGLPTDCYRFVSSNTRAQNLDQCFYFDDHENFFRFINHHQVADPVSQTPRGMDYIFTCLVRQPKDWRAILMTDLWRSGLLEQSQWSFNTANQPMILNIEREPFNLSLLPGIQEAIKQFESITPKFCDDLSEAQHNDHTDVNVDVYTRSMCNIVFETHYEADNSSGAFVTEKVWKCIKYGQPFVVVGTAGTLQMLRSAGYRVFDDVIDNSYDEIQDPTQRWLALKRSIEAIKQHANTRADWWGRCLDDILHNQKLFDDRRTIGLTTLMDYLQNE